MNSHPERSFIYCTPFLKEIERIQRGCTDLKLKTPNNFGSSKIDHFNDLLANGDDIAVTHSTFLNATPETLDYISQGNYTLIIDEVLDIMCEFNKTSIVEANPEQGIKPKDLNMLFDTGIIQIDEITHRVIWAGEDYSGGKFSEVQRLADLGRLYCIHGKMLVCIFPPEIFHLFNSVYVLTYLFSGSVLKPYFEAFDIEYELASIVNSDGCCTIGAYDPAYDIAFRNKCKELISLYWPDKYKPEFKGVTLSKKWYEKNHVNEEVSRIIRGKIVNFIRYVARAKAADIMWTCPKPYRDVFKGPGYTSSHRITQEEKDSKTPDELKELEMKSTCWVPSNAKATNFYKDRWALVYCCNMYPNTMFKGFWDTCAAGKCTRFDQDLFAVSCLIQWVLRSRLRDNEPIHLYILSHRMATLFDKWLDGDL